MPEECPGYLPDVWVVCALYVDTKFCANIQTWIGLRVKYYQVPKLVQFNSIQSEHWQFQAAKISFHFWENVVCTEKTNQICSPRMHNGHGKILFIDVRAPFCEAHLTHMSKLQRKSKMSVLCKGHDRWTERLWRAEQEWKKHQRGCCYVQREKPQVRGSTEGKKEENRERGVVSLVLLSPSCLTHSIVVLFHFLGIKDSLRFTSSLLMDSLYAASIDVVHLVSKIIFMLVHSLHGILHNQTLTYQTLVKSRVNK